LIEIVPSNSLRTCISSCDDTELRNVIEFLSTFTFARMPRVKAAESVGICGKAGLGPAAAISFSSGMRTNPVGEKGLAAKVGFTYVQNHLPSIIFQFVLSGICVGMVWPCQRHSPLQVSRTLALVKFSEYRIFRVSQALKV